MAEGSEGRGRILIVDDHDMFRRLMRGHLETEGYEVIEAGDGQEALQLARAHRPAVVLLDVVMPVLGGWDCLVAIRGTPELEGTKVILVTGFPEAAEDPEKRPVEPDALMRKPFGPVTLLGTIDDVLNHA